MGFPLSFFVIKLNNIVLLQILLQDKYNIGVLTVNIEFMWLGTKRMGRLAKRSSFPVSKPRHINIQYWCIDGKHRIYVARLRNWGKTNF
jgi:hypothetical protein